MTRIVITGLGAVCAAGRTPDEIIDAVAAGRSALAPIRQWDTAGWPRRVAGEIPDLDPYSLVADRKIHKLIRRSDVFGLYAAGRAIEDSGLPGYRTGLDPHAAAGFNDRTGVYVGSGGGTYEAQHDFLPLVAAAAGDLKAFGRELGATVNPMWLLRTLPNNVLCHIGIRHGLKGANACVTNHSVSGALAVLEAGEALRQGEADRAVAVGHDAPIEPQTLLYYHRFGLVATEAIRPFDAQRDGSLFGEGAGALMIETEASAAARGAAVLGEYLGGGCAGEAAGLTSLREDGAGLAEAINAALAAGRVRPGDVGMIVAHANGTRQSDASEAAAIRRVFGDAGPPVTGFKWAIGHLLAGAGAIETVLALAALRRRSVPGIATLQRLDPACAGVSAAREAGQPRSDVALVLSRGFGGTNVALLVRAAGN